MNIVGAEEKDLPRICELIRKEFPYTKLSFGDLRARFNSKEFFFLKAIKGKDMAGFIEFRKRGKEGKIFGLVVLENFRGEGIGEKLVNAAVDKIRKMGADEITLIVAQDNENAKKIYRNFGFRPFGFLEREIAGKKIEAMILDATSAKTAS
ncbi:MAG: GNAT family N-acetyltransferase [Candidatus Diapherotrites archaeon]